MGMHVTLEYWEDKGWYVGRLKEVPGVFSQGETLVELEKNIQEAYQLMQENDEDVSDRLIMTKELELQV